MGGLIFDNMFTVLINPDDEPIDPVTGLYPADVNDRFIRTFRIFVLSIALLALIGFIMIFPGPVPNGDAAAALAAELV